MQNYFVLRPLQHTGKVAPGEQTLKSTIYGGQERQLRLPGILRTTDQHRLTPSEEPLMKTYSCERCGCKGKQSPPPRTAADTHINSSSGSSPSASSYSSTSSPLPLSFYMLLSALIQDEGSRMWECLYTAVHGWISVLARMLVHPSSKQKSGGRQNFKLCSLDSCQQSCSNFAEGLTNCHFLWVPRTALSFVTKNRLPSVSRTNEAPKLLRHTDSDTQQLLPSPSQNELGPLRAIQRDTAMLKKLVWIKAPCT